MQDLFKQAWWWIKQVPFTTGLVVITIITAIATKSLWQSAEASGLIDTLGFGLPAFREGDVLTAITGMFVAPVPLMYAVILFLLIAGGGFLEYKYGAAKMLITLFVTQIAAVSIVALLLLILEPTSLPWARELAKVHDVGLSNAGFGMVGAATAGLSLVWRRRARTAVGLYLLTMILFSGVIWDFTHFTAFWIGVALGPWVVGRAYEKPSYKLDKQEKRNLVAILVVFYALCHLIARIYPANGGILSFGAPNTDPGNTMLLTLGLACFSLIMAYGLYAGRRVAWRIVLVLSGMLLLSVFATNITVVVIFNASIVALTFVLLIVFRKCFDVKPDKLVRRKVYKNIALLAVSLVVFNMLAMHLLKNDFTPRPTFAETATESVYQIVGVSTREFYPTSNSTKIFTNAISYIWLSAFFIAVAAIIFTTYRTREDNGAADAYKKLLRSKGTNDIGWMTTWQGIQYWVNPSHTAGFAYRLENSIAIVLSDPVGSRQAVASAFESFETMCLRHGWHPIYYGVTNSFRRSVSKQKLKSIVIGEDTIIDLPDLAFTGKAWQSVRSSINRAEKDGIRMRMIKLTDAPIGLKDQLYAIANSWANDKSLPEMGFTLGTLKEAEDPEVRMHIAVDVDGTVHGMTSWMPVYKDGKIEGWTIDIMQRRLDKNTMQGVIEYLIAESAIDFKQEGYKFISLSAAPLSHSGKASNSVEKLLDVVAERMEPYYGFKSLFNFKKKFNPRHETLYLCYHDEVRLPAIAVAIGKAYMPNVSVLELVKPPKKK